MGAPQAGALRRPEQRQVDQMPRGNDDDHPVSRGQPFGQNIRQREQEHRTGH